MKKDDDFHSEARHTHRRKRRLAVAGIRYMSAPDGNARLSRTIDILLRAAARGTTKSEDSIKGKNGSAGDGLTGGG